MVSAALPLAGFATSPMVKGIGNLYRVADDINTWANNHIQGMQASDNLTISRSGKVLEGAKFGFGMGYIAPVTVIAVGQFLLGNTFDALITVVTAGTLTNPLAMTCAAVGAIYFGWKALTKDEQADALVALSSGLEIGIEFIKSIIHFVVDGLKELFNSKNLTDFKDYISDAAKKFGKSLGDITGNMRDRARYFLDLNGDGRLGMDDLGHAGKKFKDAVTPTKKDNE